MKLTKKNKTLVVKLVKEYCKKMHLATPKIILEIIYPRQLEKYDHWGLYIFADDILYVNLKNHIDEKNLRNTIAHELTHKKYPRLKHGEKFNSLVDHYY